MAIYFNLFLLINLVCITYVASNRKFPGLCHFVDKEIDCTKSKLDLNPYNTERNISQVERMMLERVREWGIQQKQVPSLKTLIINLSPSLDCGLFSGFSIPTIILNGKKCEMRETTPKVTTSPPSTTTADRQNSSLPSLSTRRPPFIYFNISYSNSTNSSVPFQMYLDIRGIESRIAFCIIGAICVTLMILGLSIWLYQSGHYLRCRVIICCEGVRNRNRNRTGSSTSLDSENVLYSVLPPAPTNVETIPLRVFDHAHNE